LQLNGQFAQLQMNGLTGTAYQRQHFIALGFQRLQYFVQPLYRMAGERVYLFVIYATL
jgi:hypothetical protein